MRRVLGAPLGAQRHSEAPSAILFGYSEFAENLWKVALCNLESIDGFYLNTLGPSLEATHVMKQKPFSWDRFRGFQI